MKNSNKISINLLIISFILISFFMQGCAGDTNIHSVKIDQELIDITTKEDAFFVLKSIVRSRTNNTFGPYSSCRISDKGLSRKSENNYVPFDKMKFTYRLGSMDQSISSVPYADFFNKKDGSQICTFVVNMPWSGFKQRQFDWQEELITHSMIVLGGEYEQ